MLRADQTQQTAAGGLRKGTGKVTLRDCVAYPDEQAKIQKEDKKPSKNGALTWE